MVELITALAWPVTVVWLVVWLYTPIIELMQAIGQRASKLKILQFEVELATLVPASANLSATVEALQKAEVQASGTALIIAGVTQSATADYVLVPLGAERDQAWITSRLFLLAALIDRNRIVRCIVFTGEYGTFIGAASPRDVRGEIGARFPEYERALLATYGQVSTSDLREFRNGAAQREHCKHHCLFLPSESRDFFSRKPHVGRMDISGSIEPAGFGTNLRIR